jgi:hypothetical protein
VDRLCDRFEAAWKAVAPAELPPRLEDYLAGAPDPERAELLRELIALDAYYRRARGAAPRPEDYLGRFAGLDASWLVGTLAADGPLVPPTALDLAPYGGPPLTALGHYRVRRELGRGGFGIVFLAEDTRLGRPVALKVPRPEALAQADLRQRFLREARAAAGLDHPNVVPVYDTGEVGEISYIASAYCPGDNLAAWLRRQPGPVEPRRAAALVAALAGAVQHAHERGVLHRDLKPANILLVPLAGESPSEVGELDFVPKVTDFGLAKVVEDANQDTTSGLLLGTPAYMAPEQAEGHAEAVGVATDVYALGVILYELLTRQVPCSGPSLLRTLEQVRSGEPVSPRRLRADVPRDLEVICLKCLQKSPPDRYASAAALVEDVQRFLRGEPIRARPVGPLARAWRWCRRPARIQNARFVASFNGVLANCVCCIGLALVVSGLLPAQHLATAVGFFLIMIVGYGVPNLWVGLAAEPHDVRTLWTGLVLPVLLETYQIGLISGVVPSGGMAEVHSDPTPWVAEYATHIVLSGVQCSAFGLALLAYYANRNHPGFLPQRSSGPGAS